ncbi:MAG: hypothetical protein ACP5OR_06385 [Candidatus Dormibacteria bacterium]
MREISCPQNWSQGRTLFTMGWFFQRRSTKESAPAPNVVQVDPDVLVLLESRQEGRPLAEVVNALLRKALQEGTEPVQVPAQTNAPVQERSLPFWLEKEHAAHTDTPDDELRKRMTERRMTETDGTE